MNGQSTNIKARIPIAVMLYVYVMAYILMPVFNGGVDGILLIFRILKITPIMLFGVYLLALYKTQSVAPYIVFALLGTGTSWGANYNNLWFLLRYDSSLEERTAQIVLSFLANILICVTIFLIVKCNKKSRIMLILTSVISCIELVVDLGFSVDSLVYILFYAAIILYAAFNSLTTGVISENQVVCEKDSSVSPDQALATLKNAFEVGIITEEEYKTKRTEIISSL